MLDVGSLDVNGSARELVESWGASYIGSDMREGQNVDVVCRAEDLPAQFGENAFDAVISIDTAEHMEDWLACVAAMKLVCREGGWLYVCSVGPGFQRHEYPGDYWRFTGAILRAAFADCEVLAATKTVPAVLARKPVGFVPGDLSGVQAIALDVPPPLPPKPRKPQGDAHGILTAS